MTCKPQFEIKGCFENEWKPIARALLAKALRSLPSRGWTVMRTSGGYRLIGGFEWVAVRGGGAA